MGKMKELFMKELEEKSYHYFYDESDYQHTVNRKQQQEIDEFNQSYKLKYSDADMEYVLKLLSQKYPDNLSEAIIDEIKSEFFNLNTLRYE